MPRLTEQPRIDDELWSIGRVTFPEWWDWELELTPHVEKRMEDRTFTEVDRTALSAAE